MVFYSKMNPNLVNNFNKNYDIVLLEFSESLFCFALYMRISAKVIYSKQETILYGFCWIILIMKCQLQYYLDVDDTHSN